MPIREISPALVAEIVGTYPELRTLTLASNAIERVENLEPLGGSLTSLNLSNNLLSSLGGLGALGALRTLDAQANAIAALGGGAPPLPASVASLNLADNKLSSWAELEAVAECCPELRQLVLEGNPLSRAHDYRSAVARRLPSLQELDYCAVTPAERASAAGGAHDAVPPGEGGEPSDPQDAAAAGLAAAELPGQGYLGALVSRSAAGEHLLDSDSASSLGSPSPPGSPARPPRLATISAEQLWQLQKAMEELRRANDDLRQAECELNKRAADAEARAEALEQESQSTASAAGASDCSGTQTDESLRAARDRSDGESQTTAALPDPAGASVAGELQALASRQAETIQGLQRELAESRQSTALLRKYISSGAAAAGLPYETAMSDTVGDSGRELSKLQGELALCRIRMESMENIQQIQDQASADTASSSDVSEIDHQLLLRWRRKVFELLVQQRSAAIEHRAALSAVQILQQRESTESRNLRTALAISKQVEVALRAEVQQAAAVSAAAEDACRQAAFRERNALAKLGDSRQAMEMLTTQLRSPPAGPGAEQLDRLSAYIERLSFASARIAHLQRLTGAGAMRKPGATGAPADGDTEHLLLEIKLLTQERDSLMQQQQQQREQQQREPQQREPQQREPQQREPQQLRAPHPVTEEATRSNERESEQVDERTSALQSELAKLRAAMELAERSSAEEERKLAAQLAASAAAAQRVRDDAAAAEAAMAAATRARDAARADGVAQQSQLAAQSAQLSACKNEIKTYAREKIATVARCDDLRRQLELSTRDLAATKLAATSESEQRIAHLERRLSEKSSQLRAAVRSRNGLLATLRSRQLDVNTTSVSTASSVSDVSDLSDVASDELARLAELAGDLLDD